MKWRLSWGEKMLYLFKDSSIWLFKQSGKGTGKVQRVWLKLNPEVTHTEKQVKKQNIKFAWKDPKIHEHDIWRARDIPNFLAWLSAVTTNNDGGGRWQCASTDGSREPGSDEEETTGTQAEVSDPDEYLLEETTSFLPEFLNPYICLELLSLFGKGG